MEIFNSLSSLLYVLSGVSVIGTGAGSRYRSLKYLYVSAVVMTGVTSAWFHADLMYYQQKLDESFETVSVVVLLHWGLAALEGKQGFARAFYVIILHCIMIIPAIWWFSEVVCEVHLIGVALSAAFVLSKAVDRNDDSRLRVAHQLAVVGAIGGFSLWLVDFFGCKAIIHGVVVPALGFNPQLHAWWHLCTAVSLAAAGFLVVGLSKKQIVTQQKSE